MVQRHAVWSRKPYRNLEQIDHGLHNHVFDDVICKLSIPYIVNQDFFHNHIKVISAAFTGTLFYSMNFVLMHNPSGYQTTA